MFKTIVKNQKTTIDKKMFGKRLAASLLSACMLLSGFSAFAVEGDGEAETPVIQNPAVVEKEAWSATLYRQYAGDFASSAYDAGKDYCKIDTITTDDSSEYDEITITENKYSGQWLAETFAMLGTNNKGKEAMKNSHKVSVSFDMKTSSNNSNGNIIYFEDGSSGRIGNLVVSDTKLAFSDSENNKNKYDYALTPGEWVNVKLVFYPKKENVDINRCEWYVNDQLVLVASGGANAASFPTEARVLDRVGILGSKGLTYKNLRISGVKQETVEADTTTEKVVDLTSANVLKTDTAAGTDENGIFMNDKNGAVINVSDKTLDYGTDNTPVYDKYSFSYDIKLTKDYEDATKVAKLYYRDGVQHYDTNSTNHDVGYIGMIHVYGKHLQFSKNGTSVNKTYNIQKDKWYNIEYVVEPSTGKFVWYVNGDKVTEGSISDSTAWYASQKRILKTFRTEKDNEDKENREWVGVSGDIRFNNFKLSGIQNTVRPTEDFATTSVAKTDSGLDVTFNKDVDDTQSLLNYIKVTDRFGNVVNTTATVSATDKKVVNLAIENADSSWYKVSVPTRFLSADGLALGETKVLSTPHFEVVNPVLNVENSTATLNATYTNTTNEAVNAMVVLAAYNENGTLAQVAVANREVAETNGSVSEIKQSDKVQVSVPENGSVKAFVFDKTTYQPLCSIIGQAE